MAMDAKRLPRNRQAEPVSGGGAGGAAAEAQPPVAAPLPAPVPVPAESPVAPAGVPFQGLDPLTKELVESAPLIPAAPREPLPQAPQSLQTVPPAQPEPERPVRAAKTALKQPVFLVAVGGALASGLLLLTGAIQQRRSGQPPAAGQIGPRAAAPTSAPPPLPGDAWLRAGGVTL